MTEDIPEPVSVADIIARRDHPDASSDSITAGELLRAWPAIWDTKAAVEANNVRVYARSSYLTTGSMQWSELDAADVQRVADGIADGTAIIEPEWRRDTPIGRELLDRAWRKRQRQRKVTMLIQVALVVALLAGCLTLVIAAGN